MMFASPPDQSLEWSDTAVEGAFRFLKRLWRFAGDTITQPASDGIKGSLTSDQKDLRRKIHETILKVNDDIGRRYTFNTAIAAVMELMNALGRADDDSDNGRAIRREGLENIVLLLAPIVPHITEAVWQALGHSQALIDMQWPRADAAALQKDDITLIVQINGRKRAEIVIDNNADEQAIRSTALANDTVKRYTDGKDVKKVITVPGRLVNIVVA